MDHKKSYGGGAKNNRKFMQGKIERKKFMHSEWSRKKGSCIRKKNIPAREMLAKKKLCSSKIPQPPPPPPNNFSNGPSLKQFEISDHTKVAPSPSP